ncbi:MAG: hypothetical protein HY820_15860 [Acidobacteria bacterium]|nr:hypothetical protein [Acidobacteriota bacterium]
MRAWSLIVALALLPACRNTAPESHGSTVVVPPGAKIHGKTYGEWSAEWWKFVRSVPSSDNPLLHDDKCGVGQSGPVWFLTGKWGPSPIVVTRRCSVPFGKHLFFPVVSAVADNVGYDPPKSVHDLTAMVREAVNSHVGTMFWLDGKDIQIGSVSDSPYRVMSPVFSFRVRAGDVLGNPAGMLVDPVICDGIFLMLEPLAAGRHTIRYTASSLSVSFSFDVTYHLDILPPGK